MAFKLANSRLHKTRAFHTVHGHEIAGQHVVIAVGMLCYKSMQLGTHRHVLVYMSTTLQALPRGGLDVLRDKGRLLSYISSVTRLSHIDVHKLLERFWRKHSLTPFRCVRMLVGFSLALHLKAMIVCPFTTMLRATPTCNFALIKKKMFWNILHPKP